MRRALVLLTMCLLFIAAPPALAAPPNDNPGNAEFIPMNDFAVGTNLGATIQGGEPLTLQANTFCTEAGDATADGWPMRSTMWYLVEGSGKTLSLSSFGPGVDT